MTTILCIEDEADFRESIVDFLRKEGYRTLEASNGKAGLEAILTHAPDLVLCDVNMPQMGGFEMLTELRAHHPGKASTPIVFLSAAGQKDDLLTGKALGADDYVLKPVDFDLLLTTIEARLKQATRLRDYIDSELDTFRLLILQMMSHELRTPLNAIIGFSDMLRKEIYGAIENEKYKEFIRCINCSGYDLLAVVNNAIDTSAIVAGRVRMLDQPTDIESLVWECVHTVRAAGVKGNEALEQHVEPALPMLQIDPKYISRVINTLLTDALRHAEENKKLLFDVQMNLEQQMVFGLIQSRPGSGYHYQDIPPVRLSSPTEAPDSPSPGLMDPLGVGLQFARAVMEAHGGRVEIRALDQEVTAILLVFPKERVLHMDVPAMPGLRIAK